jgi:hypothetical protein
MSVNSKLLNRQEIVKELGVTASHVDVLRERGILIVTNPGEWRPLFDGKDCLLRYRAYRKTLEEKACGNAALSESSLRRWRSRVRKSAQRLARLRKITVNTDEIIQAWNNVRAKWINRIEAWPSIVAGKLSNNKDVPGIADILDRAVRDFLCKIVLDCGGTLSNWQFPRHSSRNPSFDPEVRSLIYNGHMIDIFVRQDWMRTLCIDRHYQKSVPSWYEPNEGLIELAKRIIDGDLIENKAVLASYYAK